VILVEKINMSPKQFQLTPDSSQKMQIEYAIKIHIAKKSIKCYITRNIANANKIPVANGDLHQYNTCSMKNGAQSFVGL